jgi:hypothetical protein
MFCDRNEKILMIENRERCGRVWMPKTRPEKEKSGNHSPKERSSTAQLNCLSLRSELDCEVAYGASHPWTSAANVGKQTKEGGQVGLDFHDLLIEALIDPVTGVLRYLLFARNLSLRLIPWLIG